MCQTYRSLPPPAARPSRQVGGHSTRPTVLPSDTRVRVTFGHFQPATAMGHSLLFDMEDDFDYIEIHVSTSVFADTLTIKDRKHMTTVFYEKDRKAGSVEIL